MISIEAINERSPYKVIPAEEDSFLFITKNGIKYSVGFVNDFSFLDEGVYQFFISNVEHKHDAEDADVFLTIKIVIEEFFAQNQAVMLYICDNMDDRQAYRDRLFRIWFNTYVENTSYTMYNDHVLVDNIRYFASILLRKDHPKHNEVIALFHDFVQSIPDKLQ